MKQGKKMSKKSNTTSNSPKPKKAAKPKSKKAPSPPSKSPTHTKVDSPKGPKPKKSRSWTLKLKDIITEMKEGELNLNNFEELYKLEGVKQKMTRYEYKKHIS